MEMSVSHGMSSPSDGLFQLCMCVMGGACAKTSLEVLTLGDILSPASL